MKNILILLILALFFSCHQKKLDTYKASENIHIDTTTIEHIKIRTH